MWPYLSLKYTEKCFSLIFTLSKIPSCSCSISVPFVNYYQYIFTTFVFTNILFWSSPVHKSSYHYHIMLVYNYLKENYLRNVDAIDTNPMQTHVLSTAETFCLFIKTTKPFSSLMIERQQCSINTMCNKSNVTMFIFLCSVLLIDHFIINTNNMYTYQYMPTNMKILTYYM